MWGGQEGGVLCPHESMGGNGFCAESALTVQRQSCQRPLPVYSNNGDPVGRAPDHVTTVTANYSGHMTRQTFPPYGHTRPVKRHRGRQEGV